MEIDIDLSAQRLRLCDGEHQVMDVAVSTGVNGIGEQNGSGCTPRGRHPGRDWILTRILWLSGLEPGRNRLGPVDTFRRYIYLHGTPPVTALGTPGSKGCIRMNNADIIRLFDLVAPGTVVNLHE